MGTPPSPAGSASCPSGALCHWLGGWGGHGVGGRWLCRIRETGVSQLRKAALYAPHPHTQIPGSRGSVTPLPNQAQAEGNVGLAEISPPRESCPLTPSLTLSCSHLLGKPLAANSMETCPLKLTVWPGGGIDHGKETSKHPQVRGGAASRTRGLWTLDLQG